MRQKNRIINFEWPLFWESFQKKDSFAVWMGASLVIIASLGIGYIGTKRVVYAREFYNLTFTLNFLEDIRPGTKIRYQGALVVGEVEYIKSSHHKHSIHVRIRKDFVIPKLGSSISVQTWGYFGGKFINISILNSHLDYDAYLPGAIIEMESITNSTIIMSKYYEIIKRPNQNELSPLEVNMEAIKAMTGSLLSSPYANPGFMRRLISGAMIKSKNYLHGLNKFGDIGHKAMMSLNNFADDLVEPLHTLLPKSKVRILKIKNLFGYHENQTDTFAAKYWHEETGYIEALENIKYFNKKIKSFKEAPYTMIFTD